MKFSIFAFAILIYFCSPVFSQQAQDENNGVIFIKLGNLLRRGHQTTLAETYIKKGYALIKGKDKFWEAASLEGLGLIYRDIGDEERAQKFLLDALSVYTNEKNELAEKAISDILEGPEPNKSLFAEVKVKTPSNTKEAFHLIKTAGLLVEAKQFELAQTCIEKAMVFAKDKSIYWEATAYEHLGMLGWDKDNNQMAAQYYGMAQKNFQKNKNNISSAVLKHLSKAVSETEEVYGGIEIGSKGIKGIVIGVILNKKGEYQVNVKYTETDNKSELAVKSGEMIAADKIDQAAWAVKFFYDKLVSEYGVADDRIFIVGSSAVASAKNAEALKAKIKAAFPDDKTKKLTFTTIDKEIEYDIMGVVPDKKRFNAAIIDIGGANTVIGCVLPEGENKTYSFALPFGSDNLQVMTKEKGGDFNSNAKALVRAKLEPELLKKVGASAALKSRKEIYIMGGGSWALATYLFPDKANEQYITMTVADVNRFRDMSSLMYDKLTSPDLSKISDAKIREKAASEIERAKGAYNKETLTTASLLLATSVNAINGDAKDKKIIFARNGLTARVAGFAVQFIIDEYSQLSEVGQ